MPKAEFDILGLGTVAVDDTLYVERYPPPDQKARIDRTRRSFGGQVATALAAACRLGAHCAYGAMLGDDELSKAAQIALQTAGVECRFVEHAPGAGPVHSIIILDVSAGTRNLFFDTSRMAPLPAARVSETVIGSTRVLITDQLGPETVIRAAGSAKELGVAIVMDMEWPDAPRVEEVMSLADHLLVPHEFAAGYTGLTTPEETVFELHRRYPRACTAVTCGQQGCYYLLGSGQGAEVNHMPALRVETVETTGCGDVFHGGYAAALAEGREIVECLRFASAAAAAYATRPSGWQHLPAAFEVNQLLSEGYRSEGA